MTLEYQPLNTEANEIRLITILPSAPPNDTIATADFGESEPVQCLLQHVSLDDYTTAYADFLKSDRSSRSAGARALLWDHITTGGRQFVKLGGSSGHPSFRLLQQDFHAIDQNPQFQDKIKYNTDSPRWNWGDFDALSYVWGDPTLTRKIFVNGYCVNVTENLESALRSIRGRLEKRKWRFIWADALCINQMDIAERNMQVGRMKTIFEEAHTVLAWLGCETEGSKLAFEFVNKIARATMASPHKSPKHIEDVRTLQHTYDDLTWKGLLDLVCCRYWSRLWIIQELGLANMGASLIWGNQECLLYSWLTTVGVLMEDFFDVFSDKALKIASDPAQVQIMKRRKAQFALLIEMGRSKFKLVPHADLMAILQTGRMAEAFDSKDKIYGLLGLMDPVVSKLIIPDYDAPTPQVYHNFTRTIIKVTSQLDIICQGRSNTNLYRDYPSWVVDWSMPPKDLTGWNLTSKSFRASGDLKHEYKHSGDDYQLVCQGVKWDQIDALGCDLYPHIEPPHRVIASSINPKLSNPYKHDEGIRLAFWETLMLGQMGQLAPSVAAHFLSLPWLNRSTAGSAFNNALLYRRFDCFQQCNRTLEFAGESLEHYFPKSSKDFKVPLDGPLGMGIERGLQFAIMQMENKRLMKTKKGFMGLVPKNSQQGDLVCVLRGCGAPVILRPFGDINQYQLVGESYIHGIMKGEAMARWQRGTAKLETIIIC